MIRKGKYSLRMQERHDWTEGGSVDLQVFSSGARGATRPTSRSKFRKVFWRNEAKFFLGGGGVIHSLGLSGLNGPLPSSVNNSGNGIRTADVLPPVG